MAERPHIWRKVGQGENVGNILSREAGMTVADTL